MDPTIPCLKGLKRCIQYLEIHHHKTIFYHYNNDDGSNVIGLTCSGNKVEYYRTQNFLECHKYVDHVRII